jgi:ATP/maltotriose-dependent transcriptional regulator MalT
MMGEALVRLADLRRRQGRLVEAAALFDQTQPHGPGLLGRADLAFDRGDQRAAAELAARYLRQVPIQNRADRVSGLELLVRALTSLGEWERARTALDELLSIAALVATLPMRAAASFASGYVAMGDGKPDAARKQFEDAVDLFLQSGAPFEVARARVELARALGDMGRIEAATQEARLAIDLLSDLKADVEMARAQRVLETLSASRVCDAQPTSPRSRRQGLSKREVEVLRLVAEGLSNQTIAARLFLSDHTVHRHLANILDKLSVSTRAAAVAQGARKGLLS